MVAKGMGVWNGVGTQDIFITRMMRVPTGGFTFTTQHCLTRRCIVCSGVRCLNNPRGE
jgi:hypothetical protein